MDFALKSSIPSRYSKMQMLILLMLGLLRSNFAAEDDFHEELYIRQLPTGHVYSLFQFTTHVDQDLFHNEMSSHFNIFPKSLGEIVSTFNIAELRLSLTQGRWLYDKWSYPVYSAPTGILLSIWFNPNLNRTAVDEKWKGVVHALSGQFCSSLNFITKELTAVPELSLKPQGVWNNELVKPDDHLRYALLPRESVCTENLTPWKKLLPCGHHAGFASLLRSSSKLFDSSYVSLGVNLRTVCALTSAKKGDRACTGGVKLELKQTISLVSDNYKEREHTKWSLETLFGSKLKTACPLASSSNLLLDFNDGGVKKFKMSSPADQQIDVGSSQQKLQVYDMKAQNFTDDFDLKVSIDFHKLSHTDQINPYILVQKFTTGYGVEMGGIVCLVTNTHPQQDITVVYLDVIPYYVNVYFHTLSITINAIPVKPDKLLLTPSYRGERPASIELMLTIPSSSTARIMVQFDKVFLDWMQYKPDAHHGFYLGSSLVTAYVPASKNATGLAEQCMFLSNIDLCGSGVDSSRGRVLRRVFSTPLLIRVALPDFSMPYNVLCLTCTVIAIAFGSVYNLSTKTFHLEPISKKRRTMREKLISLKETILSTVFGRVTVNDTTGHS